MRSLLILYTQWYYYQFIAKICLVYQNSVNACIERFVYIFEPNESSIGKNEHGKKWISKVVVLFSVRTHKPFLGIGWTTMNPKFRTLNVRVNETCESDVPFLYHLFIPLDHFFFFVSNFIAFNIKSFRCFINLHESFVFGMKFDYCQCLMQGKLSCD